MGIIIDIALIAILLLSTFLGYKKGLVKLGAKLFAGIIAIILTIVLYKPVANAIVKNTPIDEKIENIIIENTTNFVDEKTKDVEATTQITNQVKNEMLPEEARKISTGIIYSVTAIVLFLVSKIILSIVISLVDGIAKLPILKQFNEIGGIAYGIARGILIVLIVVAAMRAYTKIKPESTLNDKMQDTYITKTICEKIIKF